MEKKVLESIAKRITAEEGAYKCCVSYNGQTDCFDESGDVVERISTLMEDAVERKVVLVPSVSEDAEGNQVITLTETSLEDAFNLDAGRQSWCDPKFDNVIEFKDQDGTDTSIETGVYKEDDDSYSLQVFCIDDVILCKTIKEA